MKNKAIKLRKKILKQIPKRTVHIMILAICCLSMALLKAQDCTVNVLIAYTETAATQAGSDALIETQIEQAIETLNTSYTNSSIPYNVELVRSTKVTYQEATCMLTDLNHFKDDGDGIMDFIHALRTNYHASIAVLIIGNPGELCGLSANLPHKVASKGTAFSVVRYPCMRYNYSLARQIGRIHACGYEDDLNPFSYGHGYSVLDGLVNFRTIMTYDPDGCIGNDTTDCGLIPYWSNPGVYEGDVPQKNVTYYNNAQLIREQTPTIANLLPVPNQFTIIDAVENPNNAYAKAVDSLHTGSSYHIARTTTVTFKAGKYIELNPGFIADEGSNFKACIEPVNGVCPAYIPPESGDGKR